MTHEETLDSIQKAFTLRQEQYLNNEAMTNESLKLIVHSSMELGKKAKDPKIKLTFAEKVTS
jgi:hypothetical protein